MSAAGDIPTAADDRYVVVSADGHAGLAALQDVVASQTPADVWHTFVSTLVGHVVEDPLHVVVASHTPEDVWHTEPAGTYVSTWHDAATTGPAGSPAGQYV